MQDIIKAIKEHKNITAAAGALGMSRATVRGKIAQYAVESGIINMKPNLADDRPVAGGSSAQVGSVVANGSRFIVTSAQNNTYIFEPFWAGLTRYAELIGARLMVSPFSYNKNGWSNLTKNDEDLWYDPALTPHFVNQSTELANGLVLCGELDVLPTAILPLSGLSSYTRSASTIVPHAKLQMESVSTAKYEPTKLMYSTGTVTQLNYIQRKVGQKAEDHHVYSALLVEVDDEGTWFVRQLCADSTGTFYDMDLKIEPHQITGGHRVDAISFGDVHIEKLDPVSFKNCFGAGQMRDVLRPKYQVFHDISDFTARNWHNIKDAHFLAEMFYRGTDSVRGGMQLVAQFLRDTHSNEAMSVVVDSNHDQGFHKWLKEPGPRTDPVNMMYWHKYNLMCLQEIEIGNAPRPFHASVADEYRVMFGEECEAMFLEEDQNLTINKVQLGSHGHRGPKGSRGNPKNHRALGQKYTTGHTHAAGIVDGVFTGGVMGKLDMGYNVGPSDWSHSHVIQYENGKRAIYTEYDGKWRA